MNQITSKKEKKSASTSVDADPASSTTLAPLRAMRVITALAMSHDGLSLTQLSEQLKVPKTSLFSLLRSLKQGGYIDSNNAYYRLDREAFNLAAIISKRQPFPIRLHPELLMLYQKCQETVCIGVPDESWTNFVYVDVIEADSSFRFVATVGAHRPLYCTSPGLALLAFAPEAVKTRYLESVELKKITPNTITSKRALSTALNKIAIEGVAVSSGSIEGATGIASPIFDEGGGIKATVGLAGVSAKIERNGTAYKALIIQAAENMSRMLGYGGGYPPKKD